MRSIFPAFLYESSSTFSPSRPNSAGLQAPYNALRSSSPAFETSIRLHGDQTRPFLLVDPKVLTEGGRHGCSTEVADNLVWCKFHCRMGRGRATQCAVRLLLGLRNVLAPIHQHSWLQCRETPRSAVVMQRHFIVIWISYWVRE